MEYHPPRFAGRLFRSLFLGVVLSVSAQVSAVSLSLVYNGNNDVADNGTVFATHGDELVFDLIADFRDHPTIGGGFEIAFDEAGLEYQYYGAFIFCDFFCDGEYVPGSGVVDDLAFGSITPIAGPVRVASVSFRFIGGNGDLSSIALQATDGIAGPFISGLDFVTPLDVDFGSVQIQGVPLPGAWLFMVSAMAMLGWQRLRRGTPGAS